MVRAKRIFKAEIQEVQQPILRRRRNGSARIHYDVPIMLNEPPEDWWGIWKRTGMALQLAARADEENSKILLRTSDDATVLESCCKEFLESIQTANREYRLRFQSIHRKENDIQKNMEEILLPKKKGKSWARSERLNRLLMGVKYPNIAGIQSAQEKTARESRF